MSKTSLPKPDLQALRGFIGRQVETMTGGAFDESTFCRLWVVPPSVFNNWEFSTLCYYGPASNLPAEPRVIKFPSGRAYPVLLCDITEHRPEPGLLERKLAEAEANLKAAGLLAAGSRFAA